ncbi:alanine:cation symporter family protein [Bittarella massiliensis]|uniref:alanine:cation symporter family protein n=1 Tax=Bittarella massiliensis (ex Durand et al. 2017) TaxID=1720313 RepID=UPI00163D1B5C|nr:alanine:cation symporter family protein [Bittarella massiliensis (ex Durand et al. 2017)]
MSGSPALLLFGGRGSERIRAFTEKFVPLMSIFYIAASLWVIAVHRDQVDPAFGLIFRSAFGVRAAAVRGVAARRGPPAQRSNCLERPQAERGQGLARQVRWVHGNHSVPSPADRQTRPSPAFSGDLPGGPAPASPLMAAGR